MSSVMEDDFFVFLVWVNFLWCIGLFLKKYAVLVTQACLSRTFDGVLEFLMRGAQCLRGAIFLDT